MAKQQQIEQEVRSSISKAKRIVLKVGTRVLVQRSGKLDPRRMKNLVRQVAAFRASGKEVVLVSSAAIGAGMAALNLSTRPKTLPDLQMAASVGQVKLMSSYEELFRKHRLIVGQVLLTHGDLTHRGRYLNARNTMNQLLANGVVPIVNENDVVSVDEIRFGDNDVLAALVAMLIDADSLLLCTTVNGLREPQQSGRTRRVSFIEAIDSAAKNHVRDEKNQLSSGGMASKLEAASTAANAGIPVCIADGRSTDLAQSLLAAKSIGTCIAPQSGALKHRKQWIAFFNRVQGTIVVDAGAAKAIVAAGKSLLPAGVTRVSGTFSKGATVSIETAEGLVLARGLSDYSSDVLEKIKGRKSAEIRTMLDGPHYLEIVHRDNLVVMKGVSL